MRLPSVTVIKCAKCDVYISYSEWRNNTHKCGVIVTHQPSELTRKQALDYYQDDVSQIETGLVLLFREYPVFRGKVDFVARDKNQILCLIMIANKSHKTLAYWEARLRTYKAHFKLTASRLFKIDPPQIRMLLVKTSREVLEIR